MKSTVPFAAALGVLLAASACTSPTAESRCLMFSVTGNAEPHWHTAIDSLVANFDGAEFRMGVAYGAVTMDQINETGLTARHQFVAFAGVSFEGAVELFPRLKDVPTIQNLYIDGPDPRLERHGC